MRKNGVWAVLVLISVLVLAQCPVNAAAALPEFEVYVSEGLYTVGDDIYVNIYPRYPSQIASATANGMALSKISNSYWSVSFKASEPFGNHYVLVEVKDIYGNVAQDNSNYYRVVPAAAAPIKSLYSITAAQATNNFLFVICGKVHVINSEELSLDDGSGNQINIIGAYGHGLQEGEYARVRGKLSLSGDYHYMETRQNLVTRLCDINGN